MAVFLLVCVLFGGSSRTDNISMLVVRPLAVLFTTASLLLPRPRYWAGLHAPLFLLGALALSMLIQLVPLPPAIWTALPGHAPFVEAAAAAGLAQPWRPISVAPDQTINSLLALTPPLALLIGSATIAPQDRIRLLPVLLSAMIGSAVLGVAQWAGSQSSVLYFYEHTSRDLPVGFFANRNHQAVFLAMALPLLRAWAVLPSELVPQARWRAWLAGATTLLIVPAILATGSRSGFVVAVIGAAAALAIAPPDWRAMAVRRASRRSILIAIAIAAIAAAVLVGVLLSGRAVSLARLSQVDQVELDLRVQYLPIVLHITRDFIPLGSGFGTFDAMFRAYEPFWALKPTYFNHAHNDLIELILTGGVPALLVLATFLAYLAVRARSAWTWGRQRSGSIMAFNALVMVAMLFGASLTDYPLRTPAMALVLALATTWLSIPLAAQRARA